MPFDVEAARKDGYSDSEIAGYLSTQAHFDMTKARKDGYSDSEIVGYPQHQAQPKAQPAPGGGDPADPILGGEFDRQYGEQKAKALQGMATGVGNIAKMVLHPIDTMNAMGSSITDPVGATTAVMADLWDKYQRVKHGEIPQVGGELFGEGIAAGALGKLGKMLPKKAATAADRLTEMAKTPGTGKLLKGGAKAAAAVPAAHVPIVGHYAAGRLAESGAKDIAAGLAERKIAKQTALDRVAAMRAGEPVVEAEPIRPPVAAEAPIPEEIAPEPVEAAPAPVTAPESGAGPFKNFREYSDAEIEQMRAERGASPQSKGTAVEELSRLLQKEMGENPRRPSTVDESLESTRPATNMQVTPAPVDSASTERRPIMPKAENAKQSYMFDDPNFFADKAREPKHLRIVDQVQRGAVPVEDLPNLQAATDFVRNELKITDAGKLKDWLKRNSRAKSPSVEKAKAVSTFLDAQDAVSKADAFEVMRAKPEFEGLTDAQIKAAVDASPLVRAHVPSAETWKLTEAELGRRGAMKPAQATPDTAMSEFERRWKARPIPPGRAPGFGFGSKTVKPGAK